MTARRTLVRGGHVLTMDPQLGDLPHGDVLIEGPRIVAVGPALEAAADEVIDARGALVLPGLIDSHIHLWQAPLRGLAAETWEDQYLRTVHPLSARYRPEDMRVATEASALELLLCGVTTVFDFCHSVNSPQLAEASVDGLEAAGIRAIFGLSFRDRPEVERRAFRDLDERIEHARRLRTERLADDDALVQMALALDNFDHVTEADTDRQLACARELGVLATVHSVKPGEVTGLHARGLLGPDLVWVHATTATDDELDLLAAHGGTIAATPEVEIGLEGLYPMTGRCVRRGVSTTLGADVVSVVGVDLVVQMRIALQAQRFRDAQSARADGRLPRDAEVEPTLDARRVLKLATIDAANALGIGDRTGSLTPGKQADAIVVRADPFGLGVGDPAAHLIFQSSRGDVSDVFVAGRARKRDGELLDADLPRLRADLDSTRAHLLAERPPDATAV